MNPWSKKYSLEYVNAVPVGIEHTIRELEMLAAIPTETGRIPRSTLRYLLRQLRRQMEETK